MKHIFLLLMPLFIQQASADDFVLCYLHKTESSKADDWTRQGPVPGSYLLFDKDHYNQSFEKTVDGVTFYLSAISESAINSGAPVTGNPGYLHISVLPPPGRIYSH